MKLLKYLGVALESIMAHKLRAILTMLGIIIGVAAVTSMIGLGRGLSADILSEIENEGTNRLQIFSNAFPPTLTNGDVEALQNSTHHPAIGQVVPVYESNTELVVASRSESYTVVGTTEHYLAVNNLELEDGRFLTDQDNQSQQPVIVLGAILARNLFRGNEPLGQSIRVKGQPFLVVGVLAEKGGFGFNSPDLSAYIPLSIAQARLFKTTLYKGSYTLSSILVEAVERDKLEDAEWQVEVTLRLRHNLSAKTGNDFFIFNQASLLETVENISGILTAFLGFIGAISLFVGGIGIMNIMLVSVTERTREIGLRKAIGAHNSDILLQFMMEALVLCIIGGSIGIGIAYGVSAIVDAFSTPEFPIQLIIETDTLLMAWGVSAACGLVFGIYPALRATRLDPIDALRYE